MTFAKVDEIVLPFTPLKVKIENLTSEGRLLTEEQVAQTINSIERIKSTSKLKLKKDSVARRFKKEELNTLYSILAFGENYYAIYYGVKQNSHLGIGGCGYTKLAQNIKTGAWAVLKLTIPDEEKNEYLILQKLDLALGYLERKVSDHSYFIEFQKIMHAHGSGTWWTENQANLLMELADGVALAELSKNPPKLSPDKWIEIILQVLKAYKDIKDKNIRHKDLKLENIFYCFTKNKATIIDYGFSRHKGFTLRKPKMVYSKGYAAPEIAHKKHYSEASDIYALGATFFYLLKLVDAEQSLIKNPILFQKIQSYCFASMLNRNANNRPSTEQAIQFFKAIQHEYSNILPRPFRKIGFLSIDEYIQQRDEATSLEEESVSIPNTSVRTQPDEEKNSSSEQGSSYFFSLFNAGMQRLSSYFSLATQSQQTIEPPEKSAKKECETTPREETKKRYISSLLSTLRLCDEIWLIDTNKKTQKEYIQIRRELEEQHIVVGNRCFLSEHNDLNHALSSIIEKLNKEPSNKANKYFCITTQTTMQLIPHICLLSVQPEYEESYYQKMMDAYTAHDIQEEYLTIKSSLASLAHQYDNVNNTLKDFDVHFFAGKLSLEYIKKSLKQLKKDLPSLEENLVSSPRSHAAFFPQLRQKKSQVVQHLEQVDSQIDEWVSSYQK